MEQLDINKLTIYRGTNKEMDLFEKFFIFSKNKTLFFNNPFYKDHINNKVFNLIKAFPYNNDQENARRILYREMFNSFCRNKKNQERFRKIEFYIDADGVLNYDFPLLEEGITKKEFFCYNNMLFSPSALLYDEKTGKRFFYTPIIIKDKENLVYELCSIAYQIRCLYNAFEINLKNPFYNEEKKLEVLLEVVDESKLDRTSNELKTTFYQVFIVYDDEYGGEFIFNLKNLKIGISEQIKNTENINPYFELYDEEYKKIYENANNYEAFQNIVNYEYHFCNQNLNFDKTKMLFLQKMDLGKYKNNYIKQIIDKGKEFAEQLNEDTLNYERLVGKNYLESVEDYFNPTSSKNKEDNTITR